MKRGRAVMSVHDIAGQEEQKRNQKKRLSPQIAHPSSQNPMGWHASSYLRETPFNPPIGRHAALLLNASPEQQVTLSRDLQQTYGNRYVQRLMDSINVRAKAVAVPVGGGWEAVNEPVGDAKRTASSQRWGSNAKNEEEQQGPTGAGETPASESPTFAPTAPAPVAQGPAVSEPAAAPIIISGTLKQAPSGAPYDRTRVGVGEIVDFIGTEEGTWTASIGTPSGMSGRAFRWTAPATTSTQTATITLTVGTESTPMNMTVVPPSAISMRKVSSHAVGAGGACMLNEVTIGPSDVCLGAIQWLEVPGPATGISGFFTKYSAADIYHHPNANYAIIDDSNMMVAGPNNGPNDHCAWHSTAGPYSNGAFEWVIPNKYILDGESPSSGRHFTYVTQRFTMDAAGAMTVTKAGAST